MSIQHKSFPFSVKALDDAQGLIEAYGSIFELEDQGGDIVRPGAFTRTINNSKARVKAGKAVYQAVMLWQHDPNVPIGGWTDLKQDERGLLCKGQIILATQQGREAYELIKNGVIQEFSIGYDIPNGGAAYDSKEQVRNLTELRLWEVSPVTFAMQQEALLVGVKGNPVDTKQPPSPHKKDFNDAYRPREIADWYGQLWSLTRALCEAIDDAFESGDQPIDDVKMALNGADASRGFTACLLAWVQEGIDLDYSNYMEMQDEDEESPTYIYSSMASARQLSRKAGRAISAATAGTIQGHADDLHDLADDHLKAVKAHVKAIHAAADGLSSMATDGGKASDEGTQQDGKHKATSQLPARRASARSSADTVTEEEVTAALGKIRHLRQELHTSQG